jgi:YHS domain-containing protein
MKPFSTSTKTVIDPVCGMQVNPCKTDLMAEYGEKNFYFCAEGCLSAFQDNPEKFTKTQSRKRKGWWGRYLAKLNKSTDGKAIKCH